MNPKERPFKVRRSIEDTKTQIASFSILENAINKASQNEGYKVFDIRNNTQLYPSDIFSSATVEGNFDYINTESSSIEDNCKSTTTYFSDENCQIVIDMSRSNDKDSVSKKSFIRRLFSKIFKCK